MRHPLTLLLFCCVWSGCADPVAPPVQQPEAGRIPEPGSHARVQVLEVVDGDTFWIEWYGERKRVRLLGVDTPELEPGRKDREHYSQAALANDAYGRARAFLKKHVDGREVELRFSVSGDQIDNTSSKRLLAYVHAGDVDVNAEICRQGFSYFYSRYPHDRRDEFGALVQEAKAASRGLWQD